MATTKTSVVVIATTIITLATTSAAQPAPPPGGGPGGPEAATGLPSSGLATDGALGIGYSAWNNMDCCVNDGPAFFADGSIGTYVGPGMAILFTAAASYGVVDSAEFGDLDITATLVTLRAGGSLRWAHLSGLYLRGSAGYVFAQEGMTVEYTNEDGERESDSVDFVTNGGLWLAGRAGYNFGTKWSVFAQLETGMFGGEGEVNEDAFDPDEIRDTSMITGIWAGFSVRR